MIKNTQIHPGKLFLGPKLVPRLRFYKSKILTPQKWRFRAYSPNFISKSQAEPPLKNNFAVFCRLQGICLCFRITLKVIFWDAIFFGGFRRTTRVSELRLRWDSGETRWDSGETRQDLCCKVSITVPKVFKCITSTSISINKAKKMHWKHIAEKSHSETPSESDGHNSSKADWFLSNAELLAEQDGTLETLAEEPGFFFMTLQLIN